MAAQGKKDARGAEGVSTPTTAVERHRLVNGYTQLVGSFLPNTPFPQAEICAACGTKLGKQAAAKTEEFHDTHREQVGAEQRTYTLSCEAYLCERCAAAEFPVGDFIQFGFLSEFPIRLMIQVGNQEVGAVWKELFEDYCTAVNKAIANKFAQLGLNDFSAEVYQVSSKRVYPDSNDWAPPLDRGSRGAGCMVAFILTGIALASTAAVVLLTTTLVPGI